MQFQIKNFILIFMFLLFFGCKKIKQPIIKKKECKKFVVVIPSFNNLNWYRYNLDSVYSQNYKNFRVIYIDDKSTDETFKKVKNYIKEHKEEHRTTLIKNNKNLGALANHSKAIELSKNDEIIVSLDGDDWFADNNVLSFLNDIYQDENIWLTYGQFQNWPTGKIGWCKQIPNDVIKNNKFREFGFCMAQPRTYYAWLAKKIKKYDLVDETNNFYKIAGDVALMFPMMEMAGERFKFISRVLCIRNVKNVINDFKINKVLQKEITRKLRTKKKYNRL